LSLDNGDGAGETNDAEKPVRRGGLLPRRAGQGLALRPKSGGRADTNGNQQDLLAAWVPSYGDGLRAVKRSSSAPEFQDSDSVSLALAWLKSKWNLKRDYTFTLALFDAISKPLLDSIPKPLLDNIPNTIVAWRNKASVAARSRLRLLLASCWGAGGALGACREREEERVGGG
jgi:hypothetical protein